MEYGELGHVVAADYRMNIIVDWDSPILAQKANRDRYPGAHRYAGSPLLSSSHSEDAITWNVFRSFQKAGQLKILADQVGIGEPRGLLLWGLAPEPDDANGMLQFVTGGHLREIDGQFPGLIAEPDVVMLGSTGVAVGVVGKLSEQEEARHLWRGKLGRARHLRRCLRDYEQEHPFTRAVIQGEDVTDKREENPGILKDGRTMEEVASVYQLVRMALLAKELGTHYKVEPVLVSLASTRQWFETATETGESASDVWEAFVGMLGKNSPRCDVVFWQHLSRLIESGLLVMLQEHLLRRPLLYDVAEERMPGW